MEMENPHPNRNPNPTLIPNSNPALGERHMEIEGEYEEGEASGGLQGPRSSGGLIDPPQWDLGGGDSEEEDSDSEEEEEGGEEEDGEQEEENEEEEDSDDDFLPQKRARKAA